MKEPSVPRLRKKPPRKLKLVCSFGGSFQPRLPSGNLRYVGGETRIVSVDRDIGFSRLRSRIADLCPHLPSFSIKCQLPLSNSGAAAPSLVSVSSDDDLARMIDVYDKLEAYGTFPCRLRVFVFMEEKRQPGGCGFTAISEFGRLENDQFCPRIQRQFNSSVEKNAVTGAAKLQYSVESKKQSSVKKQQLSARQTVSCFNIHGREMKFKSCGYEQRRYGHPLVGLAMVEPVSVSQDDYRLNSLNHRSPACSRSGNESIHNSVDPHRLNPRGGNLKVDANRSFQISFEQLRCFLSNENRIRSQYPVQYGSIVNDKKQLCDSGTISIGVGHEKIDAQPMSHVNGENFVPRSTNCCSISSNSARNHSAASMLPTTESSESSIRLHRFGMSEPRQQRAFPYQRTSRCDCNHSVAKSHPVLKPNGNILKQGQSMKMAGARIYNRPSKGSVGITSSTVNDWDPLVVYENATVNCAKSSEKLIPIDQQRRSMLTKEAGGADLSSKKNEPVSPVDLSFSHLSLSSSGACLTDVSNGQINPETKLIDLKEFSSAPQFDESNGANSDSHSPAIPETGQGSSVVDEESGKKESRKHSKAICGMPSDLAAFYTHLATPQLQTIKASDLEYLKELGSGTYGTVYYGKWKGSDVAIKKLKPSCFTSVPVDEDRLVADFWKEAHMLGQLHHPNIVALYGVVTDGPVTNLATVMEYMVNGSLRQVLRRKDRTIDRRKRLIIARDAAFGMEYLHGKNIVHFDLKSHNFLLNMRDPRRPVCKIGDLGLSKIKQRTLISGGVRGTIPWMAPELFSSPNNMVTEKIDVYSFGIVMWELLTCEQPYANMRSEDIIAGIINGNLRPEIPSWCDPTWRSLMEKCWSSDPNLRPSFSEVAKELRTISATMNIE